MRILLAELVVLISLLILVSGEYVSPPPMQVTPVSRAASADVRAIWVQVGAAATPEKANRALDLIARAGFDTVNYLIGAGVVVHESELLPRASEVPPGYDPLAYVVEQGHERGLKVQAWWCPGAAPEFGRFRELYPEWDLAGIDGIPEDVHWLNFALPEVQQFVGDVVVEIARRYEVDGVHLDYIRFPPLDGGASTRLFLKGDGVAATVRGANERLKVAKPDVLLTAAVLARQDHSIWQMQNWQEWLRGEYIDYVMPMAYYSPDENEELQRSIDEWNASSHPERIVPGLAVRYSLNGGKTDPKTAGELLSQIDLTQQGGFQGYAIFDSEGITEEILDALAERRRPR